MYQFLPFSRDPALVSPRSRQLPQPGFHRQTLISPTSVESDFGSLNGSRPNTVHVDSNLSTHSSGVRVNGSSDAFTIDPKGAGSQAAAQRAVSATRRANSRRRGMLQPLPPDLGIRSSPPRQAPVPGDRYDGNMSYGDEFGRNQYTDGLPESSSSNASSYVGKSHPMTPSSGASSRSPYSEDDYYQFSGASNNGPSMTSHTARPSVSSITRPIDPGAL